MTLRYVAFDSSGNPSLAHTEIYKFGAAAAAGAPTAVKAVPGNTTADVTWTAPVAGTSPITGYTITATGPAGSPAVPAVNVISSATTATLTGLSNGTAYTVSVVANSAAGPSAPGTTTVTPSSAEVLTAGAPVNKTGDFRVKGTSNVAGGGAASVSLFRADAAGAQTGPVLATSALTPAVAPATGSTFDLRSRTTITVGTKLIIVSNTGGKLTITA